MPTARSAHKATLGLLLTAGGAFLFASKGLFAKALYRQGVDFQTLTVLRALIALPLFSLLAVNRGLRLHRLPGRAIAYAVLAGVLCYAVGSLIDFHALELIDLSIARALLFSYPALVVLYTAVSRRRLPAPAVLLAVFMTYAGILLVVGAFDASAWQRNWAGSLMVLFCGTTTATYFLLGERCIPELGSMGFTIIAMISATVFVVLYYLFSHRLAAVLEISPQGWALLLALAVLCMFLPTLMQAEGIRRIGAVRGSLVSTVGPPAALFLGMAMLGERPTLWQLAGTALIIIGVFIISRQDASP